MGSGICALPHTHGLNETCWSNPDLCQPSLTCRLNIYFWDETAEREAAMLAAFENAQENRTDQLISQNLDVVSGQDVGSSFQWSFFPSMSPFWIESGYIDCWSRQVWALAKYASQQEDKTTATISRLKSINWMDAVCTAEDPHTTKISTSELNGKSIIQQRFRILLFFSFFCLCYVYLFTVMNIKTGASKEESPTTSASCSGNFRVAGSDESRMTSNLV